MSIFSFFLLLLVVAVSVYGVKLAIDVNWKQLLWLVVGLIIAIVILGVLGVKLPDIPRIQ
jgi:FtsH-binding integral membrane protein